MARVALRLPGVGFRNGIGKRAGHMPAEKEIDPSASLEDYIGDMVREARKRLGWRQADLAAKVFSNTTRISEIENGDPPDIDLARKLDQVLGLAGSLINLMKIRDSVQFRDYAQGFLKDQAKARTIHEFSLVIPGLLQTPEYARAIMGQADPDEKSDLDAAVARRIERQSVFERDSPPWLWVVLDESALWRVVGSRQVMQEQIEALLEAVKKPYVNVQILRSDRAAIPGSISLLTSPTGSRTAYTEGFITGRYFIEPADVDAFQRVYDRLHADALGTEASNEVLREALGKYT